jgi:hypothetical protein
VARASGCAVAGRASAVRAVADDLRPVPPVATRRDLGADTYRVIGVGGRGLVDDLDGGRGLVRRDRLTAERGRLRELTISLNEVAQTLASNISHWSVPDLEDTRLRGL